MRHLSHIMSVKLKTVDVDDSFTQVENYFKHNDISYAPVLGRQGKCFGVISADDIVNFHNIAEKHKSLRAWEICAHRTVELRISATVLDAAKAMLKHKIHHVLVKDKGRIKGIVSSLDIVKECIESKKK